MPNRKRNEKGFVGFQLPFTNGWHYPETEASRLFALACDAAKWKFDKAIDRIGTDKPQPKEPIAKGNGPREAVAKFFDDLAIHTHNTYEIHPEDMVVNSLHEVKALREEIKDMTGREARDYLLGVIDIHKVSFVNNKPKR